MTGGGSQHVVAGAPAPAKGRRVRYRTDRRCLPAHDGQVEDSGALTVPQLRILRNARDGLGLPAVRQRPASFWSDADLLVHFGLLAIRQGGLVPTVDGASYLAAREGRGTIETQAGAQHGAD